MCVLLSNQYYLLIQACPSRAEALYCPAHLLLHYILRVYFLAASRRARASRSMSQYPHGGEEDGLFRARGVRLYNVASRGGGPRFGDANV